MPSERSEGSRPGGRGTPLDTPRFLACGSDRCKPTATGTDGNASGRPVLGQRHLVFTHFRSLAAHPRVHELIQREIESGNRKLAPVAQVRKFHLLTKELDHDDGEVTATMKVRRPSIYKAYAGEIEAMYGSLTPEQIAEQCIGVLRHGLAAPRPAQPARRRKRT